MSNLEARLSRLESLFRPKPVRHQKTLDELVEEFFGRKPFRNTFDSSVLRLKISKEEYEQARRKGLQGIVELLFQGQISKNKTEQPI